MQTRNLWHTLPTGPNVPDSVYCIVEIPKGSRNLLVAGRCLSSDRLANSALRVQATCMATGQAAGAAAALAAQRGASPAHVPIADLKALLTAHGAIVPD